MNKKRPKYATVQRILKWTGFEMGSATHSAVYYVWEEFAQAERKTLPTSKFLPAGSYSFDQAMRKIGCRG